jgi:PAS domain S-box-containing protein
LGIGQDITERKRAEAELRESEERLRLALRAAHQGLFDLNVQTSEVIVNDGYALMLGYDPATFTETNESWRRRLHPEDRDRTSQAYRDYIEGRTSEYRVEFRLRTKRGDWKWILSLGKLVAWDDAGRPLRMLGTHTDISEQKRAEETREQLRRQERLAAIGQLAAGIAHDFNNTMAVIVLYAQMVTAQSELLPETRARVRVIEEQAYRATELIGQILDFSRRAQLARRPMQIQPLLKEMVKLWRRTLPETISVTLDLPGGGCWVHADPTRIQQVLMNLATNARDAMSGGGEIHIRLREQTFADETDTPLPSLSRGAWVRLEFADTGDGMSDEVRAHLFEPFFTTKAPGEGTGLGLAQIHGIVKQHGGDITVATSMGQGTTFTIFLPARPPPTMDRTAASESEVRMTGSGQRVLVVEDNAMTRQALTDSLMALGYRPIPAAHGREALALLAADGEAPVELIVSDLTMPEMGGQALVSTLRDRGDRVPVLILTGHIRDEEISSLEALGGVRCLHKPVDMSQLASSLAELLRDAPVT